MHLLAGGLKVVVPSFKDIADVFLRVPVNQGKPAALNLHHDLVPLAETMMAPVEVNLVLIYLARHHRLGLLKTLAEAGTYRFAADQELKTSHARILVHLFRIDIDK